MVEFRCVSRVSIEQVEGTNVQCDMLDQPFPWLFGSQYYGGWHADVRLVTDKPDVFSPVVHIAAGQGKGGRRMQKVDEGGRRTHVGKNHNVHLLQSFGPKCFDLYGIPLQLLLPGEVSCEGVCG